MIDHALQIAPMASTLFASICFFGQFLVGVIGGISIGKSIRHNEVDHITGIESLALGRRGFPLQYRIAMGEGQLLILVKIELDVSLWQLGGTNGHKDVIWVLGSDHSFY